MIPFSAVVLRKWVYCGVAASALLGAPSSSLFAAEPEIKATYSLGLLKPMPEAEAKTQVEKWLTSVGKLDRSKFDDIWSKQDRSVLDRAADSIALGVSGAAERLADARNADKPAPVDIDPMFRDAKLDPFVRTNLCAAYARALATRRVYEESIEAGKGIVPEYLIDPAGYYFYRSVAQFSLAQREEALKSLTSLLDDVSDLPDRYRMVGIQMLGDLLLWARDGRDMGAITRLMDNSGRRLDLARGGDGTQGIQKKIVFRLDEMIKQLEEKQKGGGGGGGSPPPKPGEQKPGEPKPGQGQGQQCPSGGQKPGEKKQPGSPMEQIQLGNGPASNGQVQVQDLRKYEQIWGSLPEAERQKIIQEYVAELPPRFRQSAETYFKSLNEAHRVGGSNRR